MVSLIQALILSIVQGITEWLPISSSGHLFLIHNIFGFQDLSYDLFLHLGSSLALLIVFRKEIKELLKLDEKSLKYIFYLFIALIPAAILGFFFRKYDLPNMFYLGFFFIFSGIIVYLTKFTQERKDNLNFADSVFIGLFQALAILPGVSRSGSTISSALFRGLNKQEAIKFSFLLSIPLVLGAFLLKFNSLQSISSNIDYSILLVSLIVTFLVSLFMIKTAIKILNSDKFYLFGIYNIILGFFVLFWSFFK